MSEQHAITGYEAEVGCTARISKLKDELATWKNYLLTQRWEIKDMHITRTALIYLVTRATNRVPAGSDTGYFERSVKTSWVVLDSSYQIVPGTERGLAGS